MESHFMPNNGIINQVIPNQNPIIRKLEMLRRNGRMRETNPIYQRGEIEAMDLLFRLMSHLEKRDTLSEFMTYLHQVQTKVNLKINSFGFSSPNATTSSPLTIGNSPNFWQGISDTFNQVKTRLLTDTMNFPRFLLSMKRKTTELKKNLGKNGTETIAVASQVIKGGKISVIGLDQAGKTTMLQRLKTGRWIPGATPTIGMNSEIIQINAIKFTAWDLGGQLQFRRALWKMYTKNSVGLIFVVDMSNPRRYPQARLSLRRILEFTHLQKIPLAIFANKIDLVEDLSDMDLANSMGTKKIGNREIQVFQTSAKTGQGIIEGIYWLTDTIMLN